MSNIKREKKITEPTNSELKILNVLWDNGPSTVRFVNDKLNELYPEVNYTSTLKTMQVMVERKLLSRDETSMKHVYSPVEKAEKVKAHFLKKFVDVFYQGSTANMVIHLLGNSKTSKKDIEDIREQLRKMDD